MRFADVCIITEDVTALAEFYAAILQSKSEGNEVHAFIETDGAGLALYLKQAAEDDMKFDFTRHWGAGSVTLGFNVNDADAEYARLRKLGVDFITEPRTYPWGARSFHFRDPDGNIVCFRSILPIP